MHVDLYCSDGVLGMRVGGKFINYYPDEGSDVIYFWNGEERRFMNATDSTWVAMALNFMGSGFLVGDEVHAVQEWIDQQRAANAR